MAGVERALLYRLAIATGLRSNELRSLTRTSIVLDATRPYVRVKAADTKNGKVAQQYIDRELGEALRRHVKAKTPAAKLFAMPDPSRVAGMVREDLAAARKTWLDSNGDAEERTRREQSDFLAAKNDAGEQFDFHSLRHTCGAWLASTGAHPKTVQAFMRHSTITLTMDAYGHLLPGATAEAADQLGAMVGGSLRGDGDDAQENILQMTGTDGPDRAQRVAQRAGRDSMRGEATGRREVIETRHSPRGGTVSKASGNPARNAPLEHSVRLGTMTGPLAAPLAQLAEQLTLNQ